MKYVLIILIVLTFSESSAQLINKEPQRTKLIIWEEYNKPEIITTESLKYVYSRDKTPDNSFILFEKIPSMNNDSARLVLSTSAEQQKVDTDIELPNSVYIPDKNANPEPSGNVGANLKEIIFEDYYVEKLVLTGERVNIKYKNRPIENTFIQYRSVEEGYYLKWLPTSATTPVVFDKLCQSVIVADPRKTVVIVAESLKFDQVIWTPFGNGQWEVRIGTKQREHCASPALDKLPKLQTAEYKKNRKVLQKK